MSRLTILALSLITICCSFNCKNPNSPDPASTFNADLVFQNAADNPGSWIWVDRTDMHTRTGSDLGFGVYFQDQDAPLVIFLQGGGACFSNFTCNGNPNSFVGQNNFQQWASNNLNSGIFDLSQPDNPVCDWNFIFLPYTTGDLHFGFSPSTNPLVDERYFVGSINYQVLIDLASDYFANAEKVLLCGSSAGGFGATFNYETTVNAFGSNTTTYLINDSGPFLYDDNGLSPCLQERFRDRFNLDIVLPSGCTDCFSANPDGLAELYGYLNQTYTNGQLGMISYRKDFVIGNFYSLGLNNCANIDAPAFQSYSPTVLETAMDDLNGQLTAQGWSTFFPNGIAHTTLNHIFLGVDLFYVDDGQGHTIADWTADLLNGVQQNW